MENIEELMRAAGKVPFKTVVRMHPNGSLERVIMVDRTEVDYSVDVSSYMEAKKLGPAYERAAKGDIVRHFTACVSDCLGRQVTYDEIIAASKSGWI